MLPFCFPLLFPDVLIHVSKPPAVPGSVCIKANIKHFSTSYEKLLHALLAVQAHD